MATSSRVCRGSGERIAIREEYRLCGVCRDDRTYVRWRVSFFSDACWRSSYTRLLERNRDGKIFSAEPGEASDIFAKRVPTDAWFDADNVWKMAQTSERGLDDQAGLVTDGN